MNKERKKKYLLNTTIISFLNAIFFLTSLGSMWFLCKYSFFSVQTMGTLFLGLGFLIWALGVLYADAYIDIEKRYGVKE